MTILTTFLCFLGTKMLEYGIKRAVMHDQLCPNNVKTSWKRCTDQSVLELGKEMCTLEL